MASWKTALAGGITFALVYTLFQYSRGGRFSLQGLAGGAAWFIVVIIVGYLRRKHSG